MRLVFSYSRLAKKSVEARASDILKSFLRSFRGRLIVHVGPLQTETNFKTHTTNAFYL